MQISVLLLECANRFNAAGDAMCVEWAIAVWANSICSPRDRQEFEQLVKAKIAAFNFQTEASLQVIGAKYDPQKLTA